MKPGGLERVRIGRETPKHTGPFETLVLIYNFGGTVRKCPKLLEIAADRLRGFAQAHAASIDIAAETFEVIYQEPGPFPDNGHPVVDIAATFSPPQILNEDDASRVLRFFNAEQRGLTSDATKRMWERMTTDLNLLVQLGAYTVLARQGTPLAEFTIIHHCVWRKFFHVENWHSGIALCRETGERLFDVHLCPTDLLRLSTAAAPASGNLDHATSAGKNDCTKWLVQLRRQGNQTSTKREYQKEAKERFNVGPGQFEEIWGYAAAVTASDPVPYDWGRPGRPKKSIGLKSNDGKIDP